VLRFLSNDNCFAGHMWPAGNGLSTTAVGEQLYETGWRPLV